MQRRYSSNDLERFGRDGLCAGRRVPPPGRGHLPGRPRKNHYKYKPPKGSIRSRSSSCMKKDKKQKSSHCTVPMVAAAELTLVIFNITRIFMLRSTRGGSPFGARTN